MTRYYAEDVSKVPYPVLRDVLAVQAGPLAAPLAFGIRLASKIGMRFPPGYGAGFVGTAETIDPSGLPAGAVSKWAPLLEQLGDLGFEPLRVERAATVGMKRQYSTVLYHPQQHCVALLEWIRTQADQGVSDNAPFELDSYCGRDPDLLTGAVRKEDLPMAQMFPFGDVDVELHESRRPVAELFARHQERCRGRDLIPLHEGNVSSLIEDRAHKRFDAMMQSGLIRELSPKQVERLRAMDVSVLDD